MGLTVDELKKINALSLDDHTDDTNLDKIRSELVSCDDSIRLIAKSPALTGETQDAVTQALAQLQAEVRKWHGLVASVHSQRTEARDAMRTAKPKFDALPATTGDQVHQGAPLRVEYQTDVDPDPVVEAQRESAASEAITPMDATLTTTTIGLNVLDFTRPAFDPNRAVDQTPLPTTTLNGDAGGDGASAGASAGGGAGASAEASAGGYAGASGSGGATGYAGGTAAAGYAGGTAAAGGYRASSADGSGTTASYDGSSGGSGSPAGLITPGAQAAGSVSGITDAAGHYGSAMNGHSAGTLDGLIRNGFVSNTSSASATPIIAGTTGGAFLARKSRGKGAGSGLKGAGGLLAGLAGLAGITRATGAAMGSASAYTTAQAASGAAGLANAGSASSALGVNGTTGVGASAAGAAGSSQGSGAGSSAAGAAGRGAGSSAAGAAGRGAGGMGGRPMGGAPGSGGANGSRRRRKRARGTYDVPVFDEPERLLPGDPGPSGEAGSRATISTIGQWIEESDSW